MTKPLSHLIFALLPKISQKKMLIAENQLKRKNFAAKEFFSQFWQRVDLTVFA
jgi:hypothetical protein